MNRLIHFIAALLIASPAPLLAQANIVRAEAALSGPLPAYVDSGPADATFTAATVIVQIVPPHVVRGLCPAAIDWHSRACTLMPARVVIMPDEEGSGLTTGQWLAMLRHEMLHAMGIDFHGPRP